MAQVLWARRSKLQGNDTSKRRNATRLNQSQISSDSVGTNPICITSLEGVAPAPGGARNNDAYPETEGIGLTGNAPPVLEHASKRQRLNVSEGETPNEESQTEESGTHPNFSTPVVDAKRFRARGDALHQTRLFDSELNGPNSSRKSAASNIRSSTVMDYQGGICKQYKKTGHCKYGDTCKFLHDRGEYVASWRLDLKDDKNGGSQVPDHEAEKTAGGCSVCQSDPPNTPVKPKCGHVSCESCFLKASKAGSSCHVCNKPLSKVADLV